VAGMVRMGIRVHAASPNPAQAVQPLLSYVF